MATVSASWVRSGYAAFAPREAHRYEGKSSPGDWSSCCSVSSQVRESTKLVQSWGRDSSGGRLRLENRRQLRRVKRVDVVKASADDVDGNMDDEGVVKDMERYLNELSVEYENVWDTKPAWCQPWTIVLTGVVGVSLSWLVTKSTIVIGIVTLLVAGWWYVFLYTYPMAYTAMIAERRKNQKNGTEDTYGLRTTRE